MGGNRDTSITSVIPDALFIGAFLLLAFVLYDRRIARELWRLERRLNHRIVDHTSARLAGGNGVQTPD